MRAVEALTLDIKQGEVFGFLGPNGAGKTTTVRMLSALIGPTAGRAWVNNFEVGKQDRDIRASIGILTEQPGMYDRLSAEKNLNIFAQLYGVRDVPGQVEKYLRMLGLWERRKDPAGSFSKGMKQKLAIARAILHEPATLFLDEPTLGLDPQTRNHLWQYIATLAKEKGITIILTTHYMEEADHLCNRVAIIDKGKVIALDTPKNLKDGMGGDVVTIRSPEPEAIVGALKESWVSHIEQENGEVTISLQNAELHVSAIVALLYEKRIPIDSLAINKPTLEDVFLSFTGKTIREQDADTKRSMQSMQVYERMRH